LISVQGLRAIVEICRLLDNDLANVLPVFAFVVLLHTICVQTHTVACLVSHVLPHSKFLLAGQPFAVQCFLNCRILESDLASVSPIFSQVSWG
jgi:hypothetical protein